MRTPTIRLTFLLLFIHYATPNIFLVDLSNDSNEDDNLQLRQLLELLENPKETRLKEIKPNKRILGTSVDDCLSLVTTKAEKVKCLENMERSRPKKSIGRESIYYPGLYHEFYAQRPKRKIYSFFNYNGGLLKSKPSFSDLTREFSQDYLDLGELSRNEPKCQDCLQDSQHRDYKLLRSKVSKLVGAPKPRRRSVRRVEESSDSSEESSDSSDSDVQNDKKHRKPHRFQVVSNDDASPESDEEKEKKKPKKSLPSESEEAPTKPKRDSSSSDSDSDFNTVEVTEKPRKKSDRYSYLQGNKVYDSFRRRLQHFLPKRFHWDEDDIHHLGYYWFNGPRGKYA